MTTKILKHGSRAWKAMRALANARFKDAVTTLIELSKEDSGFFLRGSHLFEVENEWYELTIVKSRYKPKNER